MFNFRWKVTKPVDPKDLTTTKVLQWASEFNIARIDTGPMRGVHVLIPAPPGAVIAWKDVPTQIVNFNDKDIDVLRVVPEASKVIVPVGTAPPRPKGI